jgi:hypothetical protein
MEDYINMELKVSGYKCVDWIQSAQNCFSGLYLWTKYIKEEFLDLLNDYQLLKTLLYTVIR